MLFEDARFAPRFLAMGRFQQVVARHGRRRKAPVAWQFQVVLSGEIEIRHRYDRWTLGPGSVASFQPGASAMVRGVKQAEILYAWLALLTGPEWNHYPGGSNYVYGYLNNEAWLQPGAKEALGVAVPFAITGSLGRRVTDHLSAAERVWNAGGPLARYHAADYARALAKDLATAPELVETTTDDPIAIAIAHAEADARLRYADFAYDVQAMAAAAGWERAYFSRRYVALRHITPGVFLSNLRLEAGQRLLVADNGTVAAIAAACGYTTSDGFIRAFRRRYGVTPQRWREQQIDGGHR